MLYMIVDNVINTVTTYLLGQILQLYVLRICLEKYDLSSFFLNYSLVSASGFPHIPAG